MVERRKIEEKPYINALKSCAFNLRSNNIELSSKSEVFQKALRPLLLRIYYNLSNNIEINCMLGDVAEIQRLQRQIGYFRKFVLQKIQYYLAFKTKDKFINFLTFWTETQAFEVAKIGEGDSETEYIYGIDDLDKTTMLHTLFNLKIALDALSYDLERVEALITALGPRTKILIDRYKKKYPKYLTEPNLRGRTKKFIQQICPEGSKNAELATESNISKMFAKATGVLKIEDLDATTDLGFKEASEMDWHEVFDLGLVALFYSLGVAFLVLQDFEPSIHTVGLGYLYVSFEVLREFYLRTKKPLIDRENFVKAVLTQLYLKPNIRQKLNLIKFKEFIGK